jgi:hypothetical protein
VQPTDETGRSLARAGILAAWTLLPVAAAIALRSLPASRFIALWWVALVFPHGSVVFQPPLRPLPVYDMAFGAIIAIVQWAVVAFVFGYLLRNRPLRTAVWLAPLVIVGIGLLSHLVFYVQGWQVRIEGP